MLGEPWWYWAIFLGVILLVGSFPLAARYERWQDERDKETWREMGGGRL